jgi:hypothetical protein
VNEEVGTKEIWPPYQAFYIHSMLFNAMSAMRSVEHINALMAVVRENSPEDPYAVLYGGRFLSEFQNLIVHAAALSRYFWPVKEGHRWRGAQLRQAFQMADNSPLRARGLCNAFEHFDEQLDDYLENGIVGQILPEYIGPFSESDGVPIHLFRAYYVDTATFQLLGNRYEIQPIVEEVGRLRNQLQKMDSAGGMFGRERI